MSVLEDRYENFVLAPSNPAWGDERARDEYYRAMTIVAFWSTPVLMAISLIAGIEGATVTALVSILAIPVMQFAAQRYCSRRGVALQSVSLAFLTRKTVLVAIAVMIPYLAVWSAVLFDSDPLTILGALVGGAIGASIAIAAVTVIARRERRRETRAAERDDVFD